MIVDEDFKTRCTDLAATLASSYSNGNPPFDLRCLLERYNVGEVRERLLDRDAQLLAVDGAFTIEINSAVSAARRRMSLAHEFGHLIVNEVAGGNSFASHSNPEIERLCNTLAGELICPKAAIVAHFSKQQDLDTWNEPIRCQTVIDAALTFGVSVDLMARRVFVDLRMVRSSVALVWRFGDNTKTGTRGAALRVASAWHDLGRKTFVPLNKTVPAGSVIAKAYERNGSFRGMEDFALGSMKGTFEVEASGFMSFPLRSMSPPVRAVLSVLR
jgi:IrrE N-terminal-like domain